MPFTSRLVRATAARQMTSVESVGSSSVFCLVIVTNSESRILTEMVEHRTPDERSRLPTPSDRARSVYSTVQSSHVVSVAIMAIDLATTAPASNVPTPRARADSCAAGCKPLFQDIIDGGGLGWS